MGTKERIVETGEMLSSSAMKNFPSTKALVSGPLLKVIWLWFMVDVPNKSEEYVLEWKVWM
jgi:hypothetical protein